MALEQQTGPPYRVWWDAEALVARADWLPGSVCGVDEARAVTTAIAGLGFGPVPVLVDLRGMAQLKRPAREHFMTFPGGWTAVALLADSAVTRMMANFFIGMQRMASPIRMFTTEAEAVAWLGTHA